MSVAATKRAWESGASGNELLILLALADFAGGADDDYDYAYPAVPTLMTKCRLSRRTVQRSLRSLEDAGAIRRTGEHAWTPTKVTIQYRIEGGRQIDARATGDAQPIPTSTSYLESRSNGTSEGQTAPSRARASGLTYRGKRVPAETAEAASHLLDVFNAATDRNLSADANIRQIAGALLERPDVTLERWENAVRSTVAHPPSFVEGSVQLGHIFGPKAADYALANEGPKRKPWSGALRRELEARAA